MTSRGGARRGAGAAGPAAPIRHPVSWTGMGLTLGCVALALWVQRRALGGFFALDDLVILEEVRGLREATPSLWRLVPRWLYLQSAVPIFGANPFPYHLVSWLLHGANVALLYRFVRDRSGSMLAATVAAGLFGASRLHLTALGSVVSVGDLLAMAFTLAAFLLHDRGGLARVAAPALFGCGVLSKESVVLLPAVLLLPRPDGRPLRERIRAVAPLLVTGAALALVLITTRAAGPRLSGEAYAVGFGPNLFFNLMTYTKWVIDARDAFPGMISAIDPAAWPIGALATLGLLALAAAARGSPLSPAFGAAWWLLALAPVLPLLHHTYLYYLYVPFAGVTMVAGGVAGVAERIVPPRAMAFVRLAALAIVVAHAARADHLIGVRYAARMPGTEMALDPDVRKSEVARHAAAGVGRRLAGQPGRVAFLQPASVTEVYSTTTGKRVPDGGGDAAAYSLLEGSLDQGRGLRALLPNVDSVVFLTGWRPGYGDFEIFHQSTGDALALGHGADGYAEVGRALIGAGRVEPARELLAGALGEFPDHAPLRYQYARTFYLAGDSLAMRRELVELMRRAPDHPLSARVRASGLAGGR